MKKTGISTGAALLVVAALALSSCAASGKDANGIPSSPNPTLPSMRLQIGGATIVAELARTEDQRERGLMFRKTVEDGHGMLFFFDTDQVLSFWMKNTFVPLSIAWIGSDGVIKGISDMAAQSLDPVSSERSVRYALEAPLGWFQRAGVKVGDTVVIPLGLVPQ
ncbi:MAG TPA: DUF192 domain-containing protein [Rectinemataceae bacterium]|nr:DUF192 domain-containing protein [Rectinemataceae bacterium]